VRRIGQSIVSQLDALPPRAFDRPPVERVGAILNQSPSATRDDVLEGLDAEDADFAGLVRKAIFTFAHIPERLEQRDVPRVLRAVDQAVLVTALAAGQRSQPETTQFLLSNMSQRMADNLREEMAGLGRIREKDAELAMAAVVNAIRSVESAGEITLKTEDEEED
jgi:flagellar motor switch protein FliG